MIVIINVVESPAEMIHEYLVGEGIVTVPADGLAWPGYVSSMPDGGTVKDNAVCIYDTTGIMQGRDMGSGEHFERFGVQVRIRCKEHADGYAKARAIAYALDILTRAAVTVTGGQAYEIHAVSRGSILPLGPGQDDKRRRLFTINATLTATAL